MAMDWQKIGHLLNIAEKAHQWPTLHPLRNAALQELEAHMQEIAPKGPTLKPVEVPDQPKPIEPAGSRETPVYPEAGGGADITERVHGDRAPIGETLSPRTRLLGIPDQPAEREPTAEERPE